MKLKLFLKFASWWAKKLLGQTYLWALQKVQELETSSMSPQEKAATFDLYIGNQIKNKFGSFVANLIRELLLAFVRSTKLPS